MILDTAEVAVKDPEQQALDGHEDCQDKEHSRVFTILTFYGVDGGSYTFNIVLHI